MKAVVFHDIGDIRLEEVSEPRIQEPNDAIVRLTASAICGTDLHLVRGTMPGMREGTIVGHEGVGIVEKTGPGVRNFKEGDRVVITPTIACGYCSYCRAGYFSQCDNSNPNGPQAGTAFFGGPASSGSFDGLQAQKALIPFANIGLIKIPNEVTDDQAIMITDMFPTGYFAADIAEVEPGNTVAIFGCGPVGQFAILSAILMGAGRIIAVDRIPIRLEMARDQGAEVINFEEDDPVEAIQELTGGIGVDRAIDAVGVDAVKAHTGPAAAKSRQLDEEFEYELKHVAPVSHPSNEGWRPGDGPSQALFWASESLAKAGTLAIVGAYPQSARFFPLGFATDRNLTLQMGNCNHRKYIPMLMELVKTGAVDPELYISNVEPFDSVLDAYRAFDERQPGWIKVELVPRMHLAST